MRKNPTKILFAQRLKLIFFSLLMFFSGLKAIAQDQKYFKVRAYDQVEFDVAVSLPKSSQENRLPVVFILQGGGLINVDGMFGPINFPQENCIKILPDQRQIDICRLDLNTTFALNLNGFAVVRIGKRGTTFDLNQPYKFIADPKVHRTSTLSNRLNDLLLVLDHLKSDKQLDLNNVYLYGISEGTMMAPLFAKHLGKAVKGMVLVGPALDDYSFTIQYQGVTVQYQILRELLDENHDTKISRGEWQQDRLTSLPISYRPGEQTFSYTLERYKNLGVIVDFDTFDNNRDGMIDQTEFEKVLNRDLIEPLYRAINNGDQSAFDQIQGPESPASIKIYQDWLAHGKNADRLMALSVPMKVIVGELDTRTPRIQFDWFIPAVKKKGHKNFIFEVVPNEGHNSGLHSKSGVGFLISIKNEIE